MGAIFSGLVFRQHPSHGATELILPSAQYTNVNEPNFAIRGFKERYILAGVCFKEISTGVWGNLEDPNRAADEASARQISKSG